MNPDIQNTSTSPQDLSPISVLKRKRRPHGKIAQLPKALRDQINEMLDDGLPYRAISQKLKASRADFPKGQISRMNISRWKDNGYQRYVEQQQRLAEVRANREAALDMVADGDTTVLPEADLQLIASQYYDLFAQNQAQLIKQKLAEEPLHYPRFLNAFARLTREILKLKNHRDLRAKEKALELKQLDPGRKLNENECAALAKVWDDFFLGPNYKPIPPYPEPEPTVPQPPTPSPLHECNSAVHQPRQLHHARQVFHAPPIH